MNETVPVLILDFGSQYTQLICRSVRALGVYCEIIPFSTPLKEIKAKEPKALILSGGPSSVGKKASPKLVKTVFDLDIPVLGICYGMQLISHAHKGSVKGKLIREYGASEITLLKNTGIFEGFDLKRKLPVWMSHGDSVNSLPKEAELTAKGPTGGIVAFHMGNLHGIQFHPEVHHTPEGDKVLANFLFKVAKVESGWKMGNFFEQKSKEVLELVGDSHVIGGISGGVDSTLLAVFLTKVLGKRFHPVFVDNGLLRHQEAKQVKKMLADLGVKLKVVNAEKLFLSRLKTTSDPEKKRKIIGKTFIEVFEKETKKLKNVKFLAQGTLYPDVIESVSVKGPSHTIKTHHNVGGLPKRMKLKLIEPFRELFKDEVRNLGRELKVPEPVIGRHPFPGPGLAVRVLGKVTKEKLNLLRKVDKIYMEELQEQSLYDDIWQAFAVLLPVQSVGVMGDCRTYESVVALRAVTSTDGMTADWYPFEARAIGKISNRIINEVPGVNRVAYDVSSKPPATIEWE